MQNTVLLTCLLPQLPIVFDRNISSLFKLERWIYCQFLSYALPESLGPLCLARILLLLEVLVALRSAEFENLEDGTEL